MTKLKQELAGVIFDMDGVLIDSHPVHRAAWRKFLGTLGKQIDDHELDFILEGRRREEILRHFLGELPRTVIDEYGRAKDHYFQENFDSVRLIPGIKSFIRRLETASMPIAIATSASSARTSATLRHLNLEEKFITVVTGDDVPAGKPDPAIYRLVSQRMGLNPTSLLVLEDAPCGVTAARAAGMRCFGVASNGRSEALLTAGAEHVIPNFIGLSLEKLLALWIASNGSRNGRFQAASPA